jgi:anti-sigma B factor antagonist
MVFAEIKKKIKSVNISYDIIIHDPVVVFNLRGKMISDPDYEDVEAAVFQHLNQNYYRIVFDLSALTHTNSSGIAFFMRTLTKARIMNGDLILANVNGNVEKIFVIAKLNEIYTIYPSREEAIAHFNA